MYVLTNKLEIQGWRELGLRQLDSTTDKEGELAVYVGKRNGHTRLHIPALSLAVETINQHCTLRRRGLNEVSDAKQYGSAMLRMQFDNSDSERER